MALYRWVSKTNAYTPTAIAINGAFELTFLLALIYGRNHQLSLNLPPFASFMCIFVSIRAQIVAQPGDGFKRCPLCRKWLYSPEKPRVGSESVRRGPVPFARRRSQKATKPGLVLLFLLRCEFHHHQSAGENLVSWSSSCSAVTFPSFMTPCKKDPVHLLTGDTVFSGSRPGLAAQLLQVVVFWTNFFTANFVHLLSTLFASFLPSLRSGNRRWNFRKADWDKYAEAIEKATHWYRIVAFQLRSHIRQV